MKAKLLDGRKLSGMMQNELRSRIFEMREKFGRVPGLVTILVGQNPASVSYVSLKSRTARNLCFFEKQENIDESIETEDLVELIERYNADSRFHGILVQLPLPPHIDEQKIINAIHPDKDVDGFHPINLGRMVLGSEAVRFFPCTPAGIVQLLVRNGVQTDGANVLIVGRSNIVGKPLAIMLGQKGEGGNATVTLAHTGTKNLPQLCKQADILVAAVGKPGFIQADWILPGATVIDVGVNRVGINAETGKMVLRGDVDFEAACEVAGRITPVPGGVGPMTITMLMYNTVRSAELFLKK